MTSSSVFCGLTEASFLSRRLFSFAELDLEIINKSDVIDIVAKTEPSCMYYNQGNSSSFIIITIISIIIITIIVTIIITIISINIIVIIVTIIITIIIISITIITTIITIISTSWIYMGRSTDMETRKRWCRSQSRSSCTEETFLE